VFWPLELNCSFLGSRRTPKSPFRECECHLHTPSKWGCNTHTVESISTKATTLHKLHLNQKFAHKVMGPLKLWEPQFKEFQDSNLGVLEQNDIWVLASWLSIENIYIENIVRGKVVVCPKSRLWWVLLVRVSLWFVRAPKMFQLCINQLVV
jgi:hypothetical protein